MRVFCTFVSSLSLSLSLMFSYGSLQASVFGAEGNDRCGLGTLFFGQHQSVVSQTAEQSSNQNLSNQSSSNYFSITTGTSGCTNSGLVQATPEQMMYASINFEEILFDMAQGQGEVLSGLGRVMGCPAPKLADFGSVMQSQLGEIYAHADLNAEQLLLNLKHAMARSHLLAHSCTNPS